MLLATGIWALAIGGTATAGQVKIFTCTFDPNLEIIIKLKQRESAKDYKASVNNGRPFRIKNKDGQWIGSDRASGTTYKLTVKNPAQVTVQTAEQAQTLSGKCVS
ncbi:MAG: hypothetical protein ACU0AZ_03770 [Paracoccaceae bacterium]